MHKFTAELQIIGVNPFVSVPDPVLDNIFRQACRDKGPVPICGTVNGKPYQQTLVKYRGAWRLYINTSMLKNSPKRIGESLELSVEFDPRDRTLQAHPKLLKALHENPEAKAKFDALAPSRQHEIVRYISFLKTDDSVDRNVSRAVQFLLGRDRFVGRDRP